MTTDSLRLDRSRLLRSGLGLRPLAVAVLMTLYVASSAWAQGAPAHSQGPGLGTQVIGWTDVRLGATGGAGAGTYVWQLVVGALPPGVSLRTDVPSYYSTNQNAGLIGVATTPGDYAFTLRVTSGGQSADRAYTWRISGLTIRDDQLPDAFVGTAYSYQFTALNAAGPVTFTPTSVPAGMSLSATGLLSGVPTASGYPSVGFRISDGVDVTFHGRTLPTFGVRITTNGALPFATQGSAYSTTIEAAGGSGGYTFAACFWSGVTECGPGQLPLPVGLTLDPATGVISGTVNTGPGRYSFAVSATDTSHVSYSKNMTIMVVGVPQTLSRISPYGSLLDDCTFGSPCSLGIAVSSGGQPPLQWSAIGLPPGMVVRSGSGITSTWVAPNDADLSGVPLALGTFDVQVTVTDVNGLTTSNTFPVHISPMQMADYLVSGTIGVPYSRRMRVVGGRPPYTATLIGGQLPAGLTFDPATFTVSGTPLENYQFSFDPLFRFTDADGNTFTRHNYISIGSGTSTLYINNGKNLGTRTPNVSQTITFSACCVPSVTWSIEAGTLPTGMFLSAGGSVSGTPTAEGTYVFALRAADATNASNYAIRYFTLIISPLNVNTSIPTQITNVGTAYSLALTTTGGTGPFTWSFTPLTYPPPGLTIDPSTGVLSGSITASGSFFFSVDVTDALGRVATRFISISVYPPGVNPPLNLNIGTLFGPRAIGSLSFQLTTTGGVSPYHHAMTPGAPNVPGMRLQDGQPLPSFNTATGSYFGVLDQIGTFNTSLRVTDSLSETFDRPITIIVSPLNHLSQTTLPRAVVGEPYSFQLVPTGGSGIYSWALSSFSALPPGVTLSSAGVVSGTPAAAGSFGFTVLLTDLISADVISLFYSVTVNSFAVTTNGVLSRGAIGAPYNQVLEAPGCGSGCAWTTGTFFSGLSLSADGVLSGTPTGTFNGSFTATATGSNGTVQKIFALQILPSTPQPLALSTSVVGPTLVGSQVTQSLFAQNGTPPYTWVLQSGNLPMGVTLQGPGEQLGNLSPGFSYLAGRALQAGVFTFTLAVTDAANTRVTRDFVWNISRLQIQNTSLPVTGPLLNNPLVYNTPYAQQLLVIGGSGNYLWTNTTAMPPGLALSARGVVSGTPTNTGSFNTSIQATDDAGNTTTATYFFNISGGTATTLGPSATANFSTSQGGFSSFNLTPTGGTPPYTVTPITPLPPGYTILSGDSLVGTVAGFSLTGTPIGSGSFSFTLRAQDSAGNIGVRTINLVVLPFTRFSSSVLGDGSVGVPYSQPIITWEGSGPLTWTVTAGSALPPGVTLSSAGVFGGTPTTARNYSFVLTATDAATVATSATFTLRISQMSIADPLVLPQVAVVGEPFSYAFTGAAGGVWSATGLPNGLALSPTGTITGTPTAASNSSVLVTVTDGVVPFSRRFTLFNRLPNPTMLDSALASALLADLVVGQSTSVTLNRSGGTPPYSWTLASGALPPGMQLLVTGANLPNLQPGVTLLAGAPTTPGVYTFDLNLSDSTGLTARRTFTVKVSAMNVLSGSPRTAVTGTPYSQQFTAVGGTEPYTFTMAPTGLTQDMLPPGLSMSATGLISGSPTSTGSYSFLLSALDTAGQTFVRAIGLTVNSPSGLRITNTNPADAWVGRGRANMGLSTSGTSTYGWTFVGGAAPPGVGLVISDPTTTLQAGPPSAPGTYTYTLRATDTADAAIFADHTFTYRVAPMQVVSPPVEITTNADLPSGRVGEAYSFAIRMAGGAPPYTFTVSPFAPLPYGLSLSPAGVLSGTPQTVGNHAVQVIVSDAGGFTVNAVTMTLVIAPAASAAPLLRTAATLLESSVGVPYIGSLVETGRLLRGGLAPFTWALAGGSTLPPGLVLLPGSNGISNLIGGTPTTAGTYAFSLVATDSSGQSLTFPLTQSVSNIALSPDTLSPGRVGTFYTRTLVPAGGVPPYTFTLATNSDMPPGLLLSAGGVLSGTPNAPGNFRVLLSVTDAASSSFPAHYNMTVDNALGQAPALSLAPKPINVYYVQGSPAPAPLPITVATTSGTLPFNAMVTGIPGVTISTANGTTSSISNLTFNVGLLPLGTSTGVMAVRSTESANQFDALPVTVTVTAPPPCTYAVNPTATSMPSSGGPGSFAVAAGPPCSWVTTASAPSLLQITGGASGMGVGNVGYTVAPNTSPNARTLFVNVAGQQHAITQFGTACSFALSPSRLAAPASGGLATITLTPSDAACAWTASSASGLGLAPTSGTGTDRVVQVTVPVNPDAAARVLTATIGLRTLRIDQAGAACTVGLSPYAASAAAAGVQGTVAITTLTGCDYETTSAPSWVSITSGGSANVSGNLVYSVAPNSTTVQRIGTLTIGGQAFQITQDGLPCSVTVNTSGLGSPYGPAGGVGLIGITANGPNCSWTASSNAAWAAVNPLGGTGSGSVGVTIQSNASSVSARNTLLTIAGQSIGLSQDGTSCNYRLQSANGSAPASGGAGSVGVVAPNVCTWASTSNDPSWLTIVSAGSGGTANVQFFAQANTSASPRVGSLTIAGLPYTVTQAGAPCAYTFSPTTTTVASTGATGSFPFSTTFAACTPVAQSYSGWIAVNTSFNGAAGAVDFTVQPNPTTFTRTGTIRLGDQDYTVQQTGGACGYSLNAYSALFGPLGATDASVLGSPTALGCVPDVGTDQPSFITIGGLIGPVGNIFTLPYSIAPFPSITPATRRGRVTFGGQIHSVKQTSY